MAKRARLVFERKPWNYGEGYGRSGRIVRPCQDMQRLNEDGRALEGIPQTYRRPGESTKKWDAMYKERETRSRHNEPVRMVEEQGAYLGSDEGPVLPLQNYHENAPPASTHQKLQRKIAPPLLLLQNPKKIPNAPLLSSPLFSKFWNVQVMLSPMPLLHAKLLHPPTSLKTSNPLKLEGLNGDQKRNKT
eukprot:Gb_15904 [translate_table: standard]